MPIHDWTRVDAGTYHDFHQGWTIELRNALNRGILPPGYFAMADQRVGGPEPDVIAYKPHQLPRGTTGGVAVADAPPRMKQKAKAETALEAYARKSNRISVRHERGRVVAIIEIVSPGNKHSTASFRMFTAKVAEFILHGVHVLLVDPFPPTPRDPEGIHKVIWEEATGEQFEPRPPGKPLTAASFDAGDDLTTYLEPLAVGDRFPEMPLFLEPEWYVLAPLEASYQASWDVLPEQTRALFA